MKIPLNAHALLLLVVLASVSAHARTTPIRRITDPQSQLPRPNSNSVCLELQRLGLGGPGCKSEDADSQFQAPQSRAGPSPPLSHDQLHRLCPVLCDNQLGIDSCACEFLSAGEADFQPDLSSVCDGFCAESVSISGCPCAGDEDTLRNSRNRRSARRSCAPDTAEMRDETEGGAVDGGEGGVDTGDCEITSVETTTEPDWAYLCASLCRVGEGGVLCNCDKIPMV